MYACTDYQLIPRRTLPGIPGRYGGRIGTTVCARRSAFSNRRPFLSAFEKALTVPVVPVDRNRAHESVSVDFAMWQSSHRLKWVVAFAALLGTAGTAAAARVRFHYGPEEIGGAPGQRVSWLGAPREFVAGTPGPMVPVTFQHPFTHSPVTVPLALPPSTPTIEHVRNRIVYNYGSYAVDVRFLPDGSVDVIYNSGLLRAP